MDNTAKIGSPVEKAFGAGQGLLLSVRSPSVLFDFLTIHVRCLKNNKNWGTGDEEGKIMVCFMKYNKGSLMQYTVGTSMEWVKLDAA